MKSLVPDCDFAFPKSLWNVYDCLYSVVADDKDAIVLDFFGGSGTTAHAVLELNKDGGNRKFINLRANALRSANCDKGAHQKGY